jgi:hypothetical protein
MQALRSFETFVNMLRIAWCYKPTRSISMLVNFKFNFNFCNQEIEWNISDFGNLKEVSVFKTSIRNDKMTYVEN